MAHPYHHALSSAQRFGGCADDYQHLHDWFDQTKAHLPDVRHRAILHSSFGIFLLEQVFGTTLTRKSDGVKVPVRTIGEYHVLEDMGFVPTAEQWLKNLPIEPWMMRGGKAFTKQIKQITAAKEAETDSRTAIPCGALT